MKSWSVALVSIVLLVALGVAGLSLSLARSFEPNDRQTELSVALDNNEANERLAESAPQQQVVNGWVARDLLTIQIAQLDDLHAAQKTQMRVTALAGVAAVLGLAGVALSLGRRSPAVAVAVAPADAPSAPPVES